MSESPTPIAQLIATWREKANVARRLAVEADARHDTAGNAHAFLKETRVRTEQADELEALLEASPARQPDPPPQFPDADKQCNCGRLPLHPVKAHLRGWTVRDRLDYEAQLTSPPRSEPPTWKAEEQELATLFMQNRCGDPACEGARFSAAQTVIVGAKTHREVADAVSTYLHEASMSASANDYKLADADVLEAEPSNVPPPRSEPPPTDSKTEG